MSGLATWVLVPVKERARCKSRLAGSMSPKSRLALVRLMLHHVLTVAQATPGIDHVAVVSREDHDICDGVRFISDPTPGLNQALWLGMQRLRALGAERVIVIPADLPRLGSDDLHALLVTLSERDGALAPDWRGTGTNAIAFDLRRLSGVPFRFSFGEESFLRHVKEFRLHGLSHRTIRRPGLALDIDEPPSLRRMATQFRIAAGVVT